ncbi:MAG: hypothetical protein RL065_1282 [Bacteroidota bacterium]
MIAIIITVYYTSINSIKVFNGFVYLWKNDLIKNCDSNYFLGLIINFVIAALLINYIFRSVFKFFKMKNSKTTDDNILDEDFTN